MYNSTKSAYENHIALPILVYCGLVHTRNLVANKILSAKEGQVEQNNTAKYNQKLYAHRTHRYVLSISLIFILLLRNQRQSPKISPSLSRAHFKFGRLTNTTLQKIITEYWFIYLLLRAYKRCTHAYARSCYKIYRAHNDNKSQLFLAFR